MSRSLQIMISVFVALAVNFATVALLANLSARRAEVQKVEKKVKRNLQIARKPKAKRSRKPRKRMKQQTLSVPKNSALLTPGLTSSVQIPVMQAPDVANTDTRSALKEDIVFSEEMVDEPPTPKTHVSPLYPRDAERQGIEGEVLLRLLVNADGEVEQVVILSSNPPKIFDRAAAMAAEAWRFSPGKMGGRAVPVWVRKRIAFALE